MIQIFFLYVLDIFIKNKNNIFLLSFLIFSTNFSNNLFAQSSVEEIKIVLPANSKIIRIDKKINEWVYSGDTIAILKNSKGNKIKLNSGVSGKLVFWEPELAKKYSYEKTIGIIKVDNIIYEEFTNRKPIS